MRVDSPVLAALKGFTVECRHPDCENRVYPLVARWFKWGQFGYCSDVCWQKAIRGKPRTLKK